MLSKLFKFPLKKSIQRISTQRAVYFASGDKDKKNPSKHTEKTEKTPSKPAEKVEKQSVSHSSHSTPPTTKHSTYAQVPEFQVHPSIGDPTVKKPKLKDIAYLSYKKWPDVSHNDPTSKNYIHSERDEYHDKVAVDAYNYIIDGIKRDIKMQEEVYRILEKMDRPYKTKGVPGIHKNITGGVKDYFPPGDLGFKPAFKEDDDNDFLEENYNNKDRWTNQTIYYPKFAPMSNDIEWQKELENRPVTKRFHPDKGYKYDVEVPYDERFPHVADRHGYPEILGTPFERLMRLEGDIYHPVYLDQPFVKVPPTQPHSSLNFEEGEVVYENTQLLEWAKFWNLTGFSLFAFCALFIPYSLLLKTHLPLPVAYETMFAPYYGHTHYFWDNSGFHIPAVSGIALYAIYVYMSYTHMFWRDYILKMQYNKDKELLFVTRISPYASTEEEVFEVQHLEVPPPSVKVGVKDLSSQDEDGLWDIHCMATHKTLVVYNDKKYWNPALRKEFMDKVMNYWTPNIVEPSRYEEYQRSELEPKIHIGDPEEHQKLEGAKH